MALGFCRDCGRLVPLRPAAPRVQAKPHAPELAPRPLDWYPVDHENDAGGWCPGHARAV